MLKIGTISLLLLIGAAANAQPTINQVYDLGGVQSVINSVHSTDSCYYFTGIVHDGLPPITWNLVFGKMDFNGNIVQQTNYGSDTIGMVGINCIGSNLIATLDGNFVTMADYGIVYLLMKFSPDGDTLSSRFIDYYFINQNFESIRPSVIIQNPFDSSYVCLLNIQNQDTYESKIGLVILDKEFNNVVYQDYQITEPTYLYTNPRSIIIEDDGYLISCDIIKPGSSIAENRSRSRLIKTDFYGNELWRWTDWDCEADAFPAGLSETSDGGYLIGGITGGYQLESNSQEYVARILKLDTDLNKEWQIFMGDSIQESAINFCDIKKIQDDKYVALGYEFVDSITVIGMMICFNLDGEVIWDSYFSIIPAQDEFNYPWHELYDIEVTPDGGYIMVGKAEDWIALSNGDPGSFGWVVKTDSVGCLVPGCQDFLDFKENPTNGIKLNIFPNPTVNYLYIHFFDSTFNTNTYMQVFNLQGKLIREWIISSNDMTFIYDVSNLDAGTYILRVTENGIESSTEKFVVQ